MWHHCAEQGFARQVRIRLAERLRAFRKHHILLVARTMGSVIAYHVVRQLEREDPSLRIEHLVTVGSPLGGAKVKLKFEAEHGALRMPNSVSAWTNLADDDDVLAIMGALEADHGPGETGVSVDDRRVVNACQWANGEPNPYKSYGYLRTQEFSRIAVSYA